MGRPSVPAARPDEVRGADPLDLLLRVATTITVAAEREMYGQGDEAEYCYRVVSGCLRTVKLMEDGRRQVGAFLLEGDCLGFDALGSHDFAAQAVTDVVLQRYRLRDLAANDLRAAYDRMLLLGRKTASERIATFLLEMASRQNGTCQSGTGQSAACMIVLPMGRVDIADHLGLTVETVCRMISHLRRDGSVLVTPSGVELRNPTALRHMAADLRH
jgi:CRP-like cAMP-binding protein